jgi:hypothetical protein
MNEAAPHSVSSTILGTFDTEFRPSDERNHDETVILWSILQFADYIENVGWIDHTSDWDLAFEITDTAGVVWAVIDLVPLRADGTPFTKDNGVNELIHAVSFTQEDLVWTQPDEHADVAPEDYRHTITLSNIDRLIYT